jgi:toxin ParE1/3/4
MSLAIEKSPAFQSDVTNQFTWYFEKAGDQLAWRFINAVDLTLLKLAGQPDMGTIRRDKNPLLQGLRSYHAERPFDKFLVFYRVTETTIQAIRLMHGSRDLPRRLVEPPGA